MAMGSSMPVMNERAYGVGPRLTDGVIGRRFWAYLVDLIVIAIWICVVCIAIVLLGFLTFGLGWLLFAIGLPLAAITFIAYNAFTIGGPAQATVGMRMNGLRAVNATTGGQVSMLAAAVHAILFYLISPTFVLWACDILIGFMRDDRRFARDLLTGIMVVRA